MREIVDQKELYFMLDFISTKDENERTKEENVVFRLGKFIHSNFELKHLSTEDINSLINACNIIKDDEVSNKNTASVFSYLLLCLEDIKKLNQFTNETVKNDVILSLVRELTLISYPIEESILNFANAKINYFDDGNIEGDDVL